MKENIDGKEVWGSHDLPDVDHEFRCCLGYARSPGWSFVQKRVVEYFGGFEGLSSIELGCGLAKFSILLSMLNVKTTLLDYSEKQLKAAQYLHEQFKLHPEVIRGNLLQLDQRLETQYDISMSFGTAEHFWDDERQQVFDSHVKVLKRGGMTIICVPNKFGFLFNLGRGARKLFGRTVCPIDETPFTKGELEFRAKKAGLENIEIIGSETLSHDFNNFIFDFPKAFKTKEKTLKFSDVESPQELLKKRMSQNKSTIKPWNNQFSYPLILIGKRA